MTILNDKKNNIYNISEAVVYLFTIFIKTHYYDVTSNLLSNYSNPLNSKKVFEDAKAASLLCLFRLYKTSTEYTCRKFMLGDLISFINSLYDKKSISLEFLAA